MGDHVFLDTPRFKGEFPFDFAEEPLTALEWRWIKKISGYLPMTVDDGMAGLDPDLFLAFAVIALRRAGKIQKEEALIVAEMLAELPADGSTLKVVFDEVPEEAEEDPPAVPAETPDPESPPTPEPPEKPASEWPSRLTGATGSLTLALQDSDQRTTGTPVSERSAV